MSLNSFTLILATLLISLVAITNAWRDFEVIFANITCDVNSKKVKKFDCALSTNSKNISTFNVYFMAAENMDFSFNTKASFIRENDYVPLYNHKLDVCEFLGSNTKASMLAMLLQVLKNTNTTNVECPFKKDKEYFIKNFYLDVEKFPPFAIDLTFQNTVDFINTNSNEKLMFLKLFGEIKHKVGASKSQADKKVNVKKRTGRKPMQRSEHIL